MVVRRRLMELLMVLPPTGFAVGLGKGLQPLVYFWDRIKIACVNALPSGDLWRWASAFVHGTALCFGGGDEFIVAAVVIPSVVVGIDAVSGLHGKDDFEDTRFCGNQVAHFVETAEELGFERLTLVDHIVGAKEAKDAPWAVHYTIEYGFHEPMTLFALIAGFTTKIRLVTANVVLPQRPTELCAKQAAQIDILTGGRLDLGIGVGWSKSEFEALGMNFANRGDRIEEQVALMRRLWTDEVVEFEGKWHNISDMGMNPRPIQRPIPIWFGGGADRVVRRIGEQGDGWFPQFQPDKIGRAHV